MSRKEGSLPCWSASGVTTTEARVGEDGVTSELAGTKTASTQREIHNRVKVGEERGRMGVLRVKIDLSEIPMRSLELDLK